MAEAARERPGSMAAILGLDDPVVERLCRQIIGVWPANYNCPGQVVVSGENPAVDECCDQAVDEGARRAVKLRVSGAFHSPLVAHAAERLKPAVDRIKFNDPTAPFMSTVSAKIEPGSLAPDPKDLHRLGERLRDFAAHPGLERALPWEAKGDFGGGAGHGVLPFAVHSIKPEPHVRPAPIPVISTSAPS